MSPVNEECDRSSVKVPIGLQQMTQQLRTFVCLGCKNYRELENKKHEI